MAGVSVLKILVIGPYPPPLGGVSVYVRRFCAQLEREGHEVSVLDPTAHSRLRRYALFLAHARRGYDVVYLNVFAIYVFLLLLLLGLGPRLVVVDHAWRQLERYGSLKRAFYSFFLSRCRELVLVGAHMQEYYEQHGVRLPRRVRIESPFLPPPLEEEEAIVASYDAETRRFIDERHPLIVANASQLTFYRGVDQYGLDLCIELMADLRSTHPEVGLLFALAEVGDAGYLARMQERLRQLGLTDHVHFMTGQRELWPLFRRADLLVRPTCIDGAPVSVAEARHFGVPVVASDVCEHVAGVVTFRSRDAGDLVAKVRSVL